MEAEEEDEGDGQDVQWERGARGEPVGESYEDEDYRRKRIW